MKPVLCLGDACIDLLIPYADALRAKAGAVLERSEIEASTFPGGSVANTACTIARLHFPVQFAGTCGLDAYGFELKRCFETEGVGTDFLRMDANLSTQLVILVINEKGDRTAFACPPHHGSQHAIIKDQLASDIEQRISWLHVSGMMFREDPAASTQLELMKRCSKAGVPVSLDINARVESIGDSFFYHNLQASKQYVTVIFGSAIDEIPLLTNQHDAETAAVSLASNGTTVIARYGDQGAVLYHKDQRIHIPAFHIDVADTVGAGDVFDGAFIAAKLHGLQDDQAIRYANAAAAICVSKHGARSGPASSELDAFLLSH